MDNEVKPDSEDQMDVRRFWPKGSLDKAKIKRWSVGAVAGLIAIGFMGLTHSKPVPQPTVHQQTDSDIPPPPARIQEVSKELDGQAQQFADQQKSMQAQAEALAQQQREYQERLNKLNAQNTAPPIPEAQPDGGMRAAEAPKRMAGVSVVVQDLRQPVQVQPAQQMQPVQPVQPRVEPIAAPQPVQIEQTTEKNKDLLAADPGWPAVILPEGTVIEAVLENKMEGSSTGEVKCMLTTAVYKAGTHTALFPQGTEILGESATVNAFGQSRLGVAFHRALVRTPNGDVYSVSFDQDIPGLDQEGAGGLKDKVNNHWLSTFAVAGVVGAIAGLSQVGNGSGGYGYDPMTEFRSGITQSMSQQSMQILNRFLNRMPTVTIRPGTRVKLMLVADIKVPIYNGGRI